MSVSLLDASVIYCHCQEQAIGKRMGIKELLQGLIQDTVSQGHLQEEQADWLVKEHKKQQEAVHRMYDEEISRQRMVLEEKLARRRALAKAAVSYKAIKSCVPYFPFSLGFFFCCCSCFLEK